MDYNKTLNLPLTQFPMRGGLPAKEPEIQAKWETDEVYKKIQQLAKDRGAKPYIFHDGPPYANGHIHIGHALNKILKDIIVRFKCMEGYYVPYIHGWDTHGLPIEQQVIKNLKLDRHKMDVPSFRKSCEDYAMKFAAIQESEFRRLGVWGNWEESYYTLKPKYEASQIGVFGAMAKAGYIYKGLKPVYWCASCETALAEAEIEYDDKMSHSIYVKFKVSDGNGVLDEIDTYFVIWTTTPWTLPGNVAICLHPDYEYSVIRLESSQQRWVVATALIESVLSAAGVSEGQWSVEKTLTGSELERVTCCHPFIERQSLVILGDHVTLDAGTGCVHTACGHGLEDFQVGQAYDLEVLSPVTAKGTFIDELPIYGGMKLVEANDVIVQDMKASGALVTSGKVSHQYPHCWRCKNPVYFRATKQWFASVDDFRERALDAIKGVKWIPAWGEERITNMVADRHDWCISRQRVWGVPIPVFYCGECGHHLISDDTISAVQSLFEREGSGAWWGRDAAEILPPGTLCPECNSNIFVKESDIMDVWFDSGSSHVAVLENWSSLSSPADIYLEGSDQHRGWFQSSLLTSVAVRGRAPYKAVLTHGYVVDGEGKKMSKSVGNVMAPEQIIKEYGADILRLWVASSDYRADVRISGDIMKQMSEVYRRIRNTYRFLLGNLGDFNVETDRIPYEDLPEIDRWALLQMERMLRKVKRAYDEFEFHSIYHTVHNFCAVEMSAIYLDIIKDRLYTSTPMDGVRRAAQSVLHEILMVLTKVMAPILVHTSEEVWGYLPESSRGEYCPSIHAALWPEFSERYLDDELESRWDSLLAVRKDVSKALELSRASKEIGSSLEASVCITPNAEYAGTLEYFHYDLAEIFIVSEVNIQFQSPVSGISTGEETGVSIAISRAPGGKCERCWVYSTCLGTDDAHPTLCPKCTEAVLSV